MLWVSATGDGRVGHCPRVDPPNVAYEPHGHPNFWGFGRNAALVWMQFGTVVPPLPGAFGSF